ncbi:MAG: glutamine--tRNA ligase/YqeY domain fusion protein [Myxococcota bacterium]
MTNDRPSSSAVPGPPSASSPPGGPYASATPSHFIADIIAADLDAGRHDRVVTRFPPEPNGYPHIGHAKSICLNFALAERFGGRCHLRFDDTNPDRESMEYVEAMKRDIAWLGFDWGEHLYFASDYYEWLYDCAVALIDQGLAYVDSLDEETMRAYRGTITEAGRPSPHRNRSVAENRSLFSRMRAGEFNEGEHVLRAKIDMAAANMKLRDPVLYRIKRARHYRRGDDWVIYPLYDFTHCLSDAREQITHSLCTLEFENNRAIYDWILEHLELPPYESGTRPHQYEFARLALSHTLMSKRKLLELVEQGLVEGWDDPRMPTLAGLRRRGYTPAAIRAFADMIGVAKNNSVVDLGKLEYCIREDLNPRAPRVMCVLDPLPLIVENFPADAPPQMFDAPLFPPDVGRPGSRPVTFARELLIERSDFMRDPPRTFHRLAPGAEVRLRYAYIVTCTGFDEDEHGEVVAVRCRFDPDTAGGRAPRRVRGTIHWVARDHAVDVEVRCYDRLFAVAQPREASEVNPDSLRVVTGKLEGHGPTLTETHLQFERQGYFVRDPDATAARLVFNRTVSLKDSWAKRAVTAGTTSSSGEAGSEEAGARPRDTLPRDAATPASSPTVTSRPTPSPAAEALRAAHLVDGAPVIAIEDAERLVAHPHLASLFAEAVAAAPSRSEALARWTVNEVAAATKGDPPTRGGLTGAALATLVAMVADGRLSVAAAKSVLDALVRDGGDPEAIVAAQGLERIGDEAIATSVVEVVTQHPDEVARYRAGEKKLLGFLLGRVMRATGGRADAGTARRALLKALDDEQPSF